MIMNKYYKIKNIIFYKKFVEQITNTLIYYIYKYENEKINNLLEINCLFEIDYDEIYDVEELIYKKN